MNRPEPAQGTQNDTNKVIDSRSGSKKLKKGSSDEQLSCTLAKGGIKRQLLLLKRMYAKHSSNKHLEEVTLKLQLSLNLQ